VIAVGAAFCHVGHAEVTRLSLSPHTARSRIFLLQIRKSSIMNMSRAERSYLDFAMRNALASATPPTSTTGNADQETTSVTSADSSSAHHQRGLEHYKKGEYEVSRHLGTGPVDGDWHEDEALEERQDDLEEADEDLEPLLAYEDRYYRVQSQFVRDVEQWLEERAVGQGKERG
jgi:hypothetical protein